MTGVEWAILFKPLIFLFGGTICIPIRMAAERLLPQGKARRLLLQRIGRSDDGGGSGDTLQRLDR